MANRKTQKKKSRQQAKQESKWANVILTEDKGALLPLSEEQVRMFIENEK